MEKKSFIRKILLSLPFWWIALTAIYILSGYFTTSRLTWVLGLFVPVGFYTFFITSIAPIGIHSWLITFPLVLLTIFIGHLIIRAKNLSPVLNIFIILCILFALTIAVDLLVWGNWQSWEVLKAGDIPSN